MEHCNQVRFIYNTNKLLFKIEISAMVSIFIPQPLSSFNQKIGEALWHTFSWSYRVPGRDMPAPSHCRLPDHHYRRMYVRSFPLSEIIKRIYQRGFRGDRSLFF